MKKICLINSYFGKWPSYFPYFLKSCEYNPNINWLIFTDCGKPNNYPENVRIIDFTLKDLNKLASKKLGFKINVKKPYKICDLRPAFGEIFKDYLKDYDFWGNTDLDIMYGNIRNFITKEVLSRYNIIRGRKGTLAGHFTIYKKNKKINNLFKKNKDYKKIFIRFV